MLLWEKVRNDNHYRLTSAGASRRLYRNGVFHSQYHMGRIANGGVWDMLWLPCLIRDPHSVQRILLLGVGLGAALLKLRCFLPDVEITAVDIDPMHLSLAKKLVRQQDVANSGQGDRAKGTVNWVRADALQWLKTQEDRFDIIIDDLFFDISTRQGIVEPARVIGFNESPPGTSGDPKKTWMQWLKQSLQKDGVLIANCESHRSVSEGFKLWVGQSCHAKGMGLRVEHYENRVGVFWDTQSSDANLRESWIENAKLTILDSRWSQSLGKPPSVLSRELSKLFESIKVRRCKG